MAFDGIVIASLVDELKRTLVGGRIAKISMPDKDELILQIKNKACTHKLLLSSCASLPLIYLSRETKQNPLNAPAFCMLLRKHIGSAKISEISQEGLERIVRIGFEHLDELGDPAKKNLYIELMGKHSNIIFTDHENKILDSIKRIPAHMSSLREVLPGREYYLPEALKKINPFEATQSLFAKELRSSLYPAGKALYMIFGGISPLIADEICYRSGIGTESFCRDLSEIELLHFYHIFQLFLDEIREGKFCPVMVCKEGKPYEFSALDLQIFDIRQFEKVKYESMSELLYDYYAMKESLLRKKQKSSELRKTVNSALERAVKKYSLQEKQLQSSLKKDKFKVYGDLLNTFGYELSGGEKEFICKNYYDHDREIKIPLDETLSARENAKKYYDKYAKLKRTEEALAKEIDKTQFDIEHLNSILTSLDSASEDSDFAQIKDELFRFGHIKKAAQDKKLRQVSKPLHYLSSEGFHIYVGKNNYQNEEVSFKIAEANDWWFHAKSVPGSHVIVKSANGEIGDRTFEEAAMLAAYYSKSRESDKVEVDYIQRKHLRKVNASAPGFVIYHNNWSMMVSPSNRLRLLES
ncbi:MAG: NFACT RNA binding domain-containing protein [Johnsonella sp.]|nr:NFACT RNA binding domain-containing protein [Johnsonella sp.]